jgi:ABC-2 type transport system permease protein
MIQRALKETVNVFKLVGHLTIREPLSAISILILYSFFYLIGYFLYGFATNEAGQFQKYLITGFIVSSFVFQSLSWWGFTLAELRFRGLLEEVLLGYSYIEVYQLGAMLFATVINLISVGVALIGLYFIFGYQMFSVHPAMFVVIVILAIESYFFSMLSNGLFIFFSEYWIISNVVSYLMLVISPILYPLNFLPKFLQYLAFCFPITWGVELLRYYMYSIEYMPAGKMWLWYIITCVSWSFASFILWKMAYRVGRRTGELYST